MLTQTPLVSREALQRIRRARPATLLRWFNELNNGTRQELPEEFGDCCLIGRTHQTMDQIAHELGMRYMRQLRAARRA